MLSLMLTLSACSEVPEDAAPPFDAYANRSMLSHYQNPFPDSLEPATFDLSSGVAPARVRPIDSLRARQLTPLIDQIALREGVEPALVHAVISQESRYNPSAVSPVGATGLMQLMPGTAADFGLMPSERFDPARNITAGVRYLKFLARLFGGNVDLILAGYNAGQGNVLKYGRQIPPFSETQTYVRRVKGYLAHYRQRARSGQRRALLAESLQRARARERHVSRPLPGMSTGRTPGSW